MTEQDKLDAQEAGWDAEAESGSIRVNLRSQLLHEIAIEEQDVQEMYSEQDGHKEGIMEGLRLARIIIKQVIPEG